MKKNKKNRKGVMYSTNPDFEFEYENEKMIPYQIINKTLKYALTNIGQGKLLSS